VSNNLLNNINASVVQIGNGSSGSISVQGNIDLHQANIGELYATASGAYIASQSKITLSSNSDIFVLANTINTGSVAGGSSAVFVSNGLLEVDGSITTPSVVLEGNPVTFSPICFEDNCSVVSSLKIASLPEANLWQSATAKGLVLHEDNRLSVSKGAMLIAASKNLVLNIDNLNVFLQKGTVVLVDCDGLGVSVFCLVDQALNSVTITPANCEKTNMSMGQTCLVAKDPNSLTHLISSRQVALRRLQLNEQKNQAYATAEYSFIALAAKYECLKSLLN
jgi:hypothetical protein